MEEEGPQAQALPVLQSKSKDRAGEALSNKACSAFTGSTSIPSVKEMGKRATFKAATSLASETKTRQTFYCIACVSANGIYS